MQVLHQLNLSLPGKKRMVNKIPVKNLCRLIAKSAGPACSRTLAVGGGSAMADAQRSPSPCSQPWEMQLSTQNTLDYAAYTEKNASRC